LPATCSLHRWIAVVSTCGVLAFNLRCAIRFDARPEPVLQRALAEWVQRSQPADALIPPVRMVPLLRYWEHRPNTLHLFTCLNAGTATNRFRRLETVIDERLASGATVLYTPLAVEDLRPYAAQVQVTPEDVTRFFDRYPRRPAFTFAHT